MASELGVTAYNADGVELSAAPTPTVRPPVQFQLTQNYPNPFNPTTRIKFTVSGKSYVEIVVYNVLGQSIRRLVRQWEQAGNYSIDFNALGLPSGVYIYRMSASGANGLFTESKKMVLLR